MGIILGIGNCLIDLNNQIIFFIMHELITFKKAIIFFFVL